MKRITLNIDLEENKLLEAEVKEALDGYARGVAREALRDVIEEEAKRIVKATLADKSSDLYQEIEAGLRNAVRQEISVAGFDHRFVRATIGQRITESAEYVLNEMKKKIENEMQKVVYEEAIQLTSRGIGKLVMDAIANSAGGHDEKATG